MTNDLDEANLAVDVLDADLFKLSTTTSIDYEKTNSILKSIKHSLCHFITPWKRTKRLYEQLRELINEISTEKNGGGDIKTKLMDVYQDLHKNFETVCATGDINYFNSLCDDLMVLHDFSPEMKKQGIDIYKKYIQMMKNAGTCRAFLPRLSPQKIVKGGKPWIARKDAIDSMTNNFSQLYSSINDVITSFDSPPDVDKDTGGETDLGIDDEQAEVKRAEAIHYILTLEWSIPQTARHLNMTPEELAELLGIGG
jgi:hypothetical protein